MSFDIDVAIVIGFLLLNLGVGLYNARSITTIKEYALGNQNFSTGTITATIVATWVGGNFFAFLVSKAYSDGIYYIVPILIDYSVTFFIIGYFLAPRMQQFLGDISVAESMGKLYGNQVRIITAISGFLAISGLIAIQFKISASLLSYFFSISELQAIFLTSSIVVIYSSLGGIKSVAFTDVLQFFTFGVVIPILGFVIWRDVQGVDAIISTLSNNENYNISNFSFSNPSFINMLQLSLIFVIPALHPSLFQRMSMSSDITQLRSSFFFSSLVAMFLVGITCLIGILMLTVNPNLDPSNLWIYIIDNYTSPGLKGFAIIGIISMIMSTADSYINSSGILVSNDIYGLMVNLTKKKQLFITKLMSLVVGSVSIYLAMSTADILNLLLIANNFYMPIVTVPLLLAIFGFKSSTKSVLIGMGAGLLSVILWRWFIMAKIGIDSLLPGMLFNLIFFLGSHYLFKQAGGWKKHKRVESSRLIKTTKNIFDQIKSFQPLEFCLKNTPNNENTYIFFAIFCVISILSSMYSLNFEFRKQYFDAIELMAFFGLVIALGFFTFPIWNASLKNQKFISVFWIISLFYILMFKTGIELLLSQFGHFQLMILLFSMVVLSMLVQWKAVLSMIFIGTISVILFFKVFFVDDSIVYGFKNFQFKFIYLMFLMCSILIAFFKPKQEYLEATEEKAEHLKHEVKGLEREVGHARGELENVVQGLEFLENQFQDKEGKLKSKEIYLKDQLKLRNIEISKLKDLKDEFIRNIPHEANTPMTGILSLSEVLYSCYDSLDEKIVKQSIKDIVSSSDRLKSFVSNIADLSKLSALTYELNKTEVDLSILVRERPVLYKKIFADDDRQEFIFKVEDNIIVHCDEYYITQAIDNLISNSVKYGEDKPIIISLTKTVDNNIQFSISDQGIGIPQDELIGIFNKFTVSSKTRTPAGGRGVGLALCEKVITVHGGTIEAQSDGEKGSSFSFVLPL